MAVVVPVSMNYYKNGESSCDDANDGNNDQAFQLMDSCYIQGKSCLSNVAYPEHICTWSTQ